MAKFAGVRAYLCSTVFWAAAFFGGLPPGAAGARAAEEIPTSPAMRHPWRAWVHGDLLFAEYREAVRSQNAEGLWRGRINRLGVAAGYLPESGFQALARLDHPWLLQSDLEYRRAGEAISTADYAYEGSEITLRVGHRFLEVFPDFDLAWGVHLGKFWYREAFRFSTNEFHQNTRLLLTGAYGEGTYFLSRVVRLRWDFALAWLVGTADTDEATFDELHGRGLYARFDFGMYLKVYGKLETFALLLYESRYLCGERTPAAEWPDNQLRAFGLQLGVGLRF